jgi:hypothetical protein
MGISGYLITPHMNGNDPVHQEQHVEKQKSRVTVGYSTGAASPQGDATTVNADTTMTASYTWTIPQVSDITDEKIVSLPFGPSDWQWQIVVYPGGAGDALGSHLSGFLRPLRSLEEVSAGMEWFRPVNKFSIKVHRGTLQSQTISYGQDAEDLNAEDSILLEEISLPNFSGFSSRVPGWGFSTLLPLDMLPEALNSVDSSVTLTATVESPVSHSWTIHSFPWNVPNFNYLSTEPGEIYSPAFGPDNNRWSLQLSVHDGMLAGHLQPVLTDEEVALGDGWSRSISSFTLKIRQFGPYAMGPGPHAHIVTKTLTGGFTFNSMNLLTGWPNFSDIAKIEDGLFSDGSIIVDAEVIWDPAAIEKERRGLVGLAASKSSELKQQVESYEKELEDLKAKLTVADSDKLRVQIEANETILGLKTKLAKNNEKIEQLEAEVEVGRNAQAEIGKMVSRMKEAKARVAQARAKMDEDYLDLEEYANQDDQSPEARDAEHFATKAKLLAVESELWSSKEELRIRTLELWSSREELRVKSDSSAPPASSHMSRRLSLPSPSNAYGPNEGEADMIPVSVAIENMRTELDSARIALSDATSRAPPPDIPSAAYEAEKAAVRADLAMIHAELEVARASLIDAAINEHPDVLETTGGAQYIEQVSPGLLEEVASIVDQLEKARDYVKYDLFFMNSNGVTTVDPTTGTSSQPGVDGTLVIATSTDTSMQQQGYYDQSGQYVDTQQYQQSYQYYQQSYAQPDYETMRQLEVEKAKNSAAQAEIEALKLQVSTLASVAATAPAAASPAAVSSLPALSIGERPAGRGTHSPEPWTPVDEDGSGPVNAAQLSKELAVSFLDCIKELGLMT